MAGTRNDREGGEIGQEAETTHDREAHGPRQMFGDGARLVGPGIDLDVVDGHCGAYRATLRQAVIGRRLMCPASFAELR